MLVKSSQYVFEESSLVLDGEKGCGKSVVLAHAVLWARAQVRMWMFFFFSCCVVESKATIGVVGVVSERLFDGSRWSYRAQQARSNSLGPAFGWEKQHPVFFF